MRIAPPSLPPHHSCQTSSSPSWLKHSSEGVIGISVFLQSHLQSPSGLPDVDLATAAGGAICHIALLTKR